MKREENFRSLKQKPTGLTNRINYLMGHKCNNSVAHVTLVVLPSILTGNLLIYFSIDLFMSLCPKSFFQRKIQVTESNYKTVSVKINRLN